MLNAAPPRAGKCNLQAPQLFKLLTCNVKTFLLGDLKGDILFCEREYPPLSVPCAAQGTNAALSRCHIIFYSALGSFSAGFISSAQMTIARIVFGSMYVPLYSTE